MKISFLKNKRTVQTVLIIILAIVLLCCGVVYVKSNQSPLTVSATYTQTEEKLMSVLSKIDGVGEIDAFVHETDGKITGVILVFDGADRLSVRLDVMQATATALGISQQEITIYKKTK